MLTLMEKVDLLQKAPIFREVRTESLSRLASVAEEMNFEERHVLFRENEAADAMFVVLAGEVELRRDGKEPQKLGNPQVVGALELLAGGSHSGTGVATEPLHALRIEQQDFYDMMAEDFGVTRGVLRALVGLAAGGA